MTPTEKLLHHVRCKQFLLCAYTPTDADPNPALTLADITSLLRINSADCIGLVRRLQSKGLVEPRLDGEPGSIQLTPKGRRLVARMTRASSQQPA